MAAAFAVAIAAVTIGCQPRLTDEQITDIARQAYIYGYPVVENYRVIYNSTQDKNYPQYSPFNTFYNAYNVSTPDDTIFVSPNVDTPYSYASLYIKDEPVVISIPPFEDNRFIGVPIYDLYTYVIYTISPLNHGHNGGNFMIASVNWDGNIPEGLDITQIIRCETDLAYVLVRTQLFDQADLGRVHEIQSQYKIWTLSEYEGVHPKPEAPKSLMAPLQAQSPTSTPSIDFFKVLNFALGFTTTDSSEVQLMKEFKKIGIVPGKEFKVKDPQTEKALLAGIAAGQKEMMEYLPKITSSAQIFGSRATLGDNYIGRAVGAWTGIYANTQEVFLGISGVERQGDGQPFSGANKYRMTFGADNFPPVDAFWSITMYKLPSRFLYANALNRYAINSTMENDLVRNPDGSVTIYIQHDSPGKELEKNWLPCPEGMFTMAFRCYLPREELRNGQWQSPPVEMAKN